jgi:hypothetical protein
MIYHDEIHFTTLYIAELGTRAEPLGEGARAEKGKGKATKASAEERGHATCKHCVPIFINLANSYIVNVPISKSRISCNI